MHALASASRAGDAECAGVHAFGDERDVRAAGAADAQHVLFALFKRRDEDFVVRELSIDGTRVASVPPGPTRLPARPPAAAPSLAAGGGAGDEARPPFRREAFCVVRASAAAWSAHRAAFAGVLRSAWDARGPDAAEREAERVCAWIDGVCAAADAAASSAAPVEVSPLVLERVDRDQRAALHVVFRRHVPWIVVERPSSDGEQNAPDDMRALALVYAPGAFAWLLESPLGEAGAVALNLLANDWHPPGATSSTVLPALADKAARGAVHELLRKRFPFVRATTLADTGQIKVVRRWTATKRARREAGGERAEPAMDVLQFVLEKRGLSTNDALVALSARVGLPVDLFSVAGLKDKHALTAQFVTVRASKVQPMALVVGAQATRGVRVGEFSYCASMLVRGSCGGNEFQLRLAVGVERGNAVADADADADACARARDTVERRLRGIEARGFVNWYGMQRFSVNDTDTIAIGRALLAGAHADALRRLVVHVCRALARDGPTIAQLFDAGDYSGAARLLPGSQRALRAGLEQLTAQQQRLQADGLGEEQARNDAAAGVLRRVPQCSFFVSVYQSYVWNRVASELVLAEHSSAASSEGRAHFCCVHRGSAATVADTDPGGAPKRLHGVEALLDAQLPLVTADMDELGLCADCRALASIDRLLAADGLSRAHVQRARDALGLVLHPSLRSVRVVPGELSWRWEDGPAAAAPSAASASVAPSESDRAPQTVTVRAAGKSCEVRGPLQHLWLTFRLPPGAYATSLLRALFDVAFDMAGGARSPAGPAGRAADSDSDLSDE